MGQQKHEHEQQERPQEQPTVREISLFNPWDEAFNDDMGKDDKKF